MNIKCPYLKDNKCGYNENCVGCINDPHKRPMSYSDFRDNHCHLVCNDCKHCGKNCKRLDHNHYCFAKPIFKSYDAGNGSICSDFEPNEWELWLFRHWQSNYINDYRNSIKPTANINLCINKDFEKRYSVNYLQFFDNDFKNQDGSLKWIKKGYYKQCRSGFGYKYVYEYNI